jgi:hypothetical protein
MLQHDESSPRPRSRLYNLVGTKGYIKVHPELQIALEPDSHKYLSEKETRKLIESYKHPISVGREDKAKVVGGHDGMDYIMDYRLIYCLRKGLPLDQDVYDAAEWCSVIELSGHSTANHGMPVKIPDFTRGSWEKIKTVTYYL